MTEPKKRGRGRPQLSEGEPIVVRRVVLPADLDAQAAAAKGPLGWSEYLRGLVERAVGWRDVDGPEGDR